MTSLHTDSYTPELLALLATATEEIDLHIDDRGLCAACGSAWPCERARLAEHALAAF